VTEMEWNSAPYGNDGWPNASKVAGMHRDSLMNM